MYPKALSLLWSLNLPSNDKPSRKMVLGSTSNIVIFKIFIKSFFNWNNYFSTPTSIQLLKDNCLTVLVEILQLNWSHYNLFARKDGPLKSYCQENPQQSWKEEEACLSKDSQEISTSCHWFQEEKKVQTRQECNQRNQTLSEEHWTSHAKGTLPKKR